MMFIEDMGQQLAYKPFAWMSWWWGIKWGDFIEISPQLSKENPLWQREKADLENLRLFKQTPDELQQQIAAYWERSFWRRCLLRLFTDITSRIMVWSYYQRCLSFQRIHQENLLLERRLLVYEPEQQLVDLFIKKLTRDHSNLEHRLEAYAGNTQWMEKNLDALLTQHEKKRQRIFLKLLDRYLKKLPEDCDRESVQRKLEDEYSELGKILRNYFQHWCQPCKPIQENPCRALVYVGPAVVEKTIRCSLAADLNSSLSSINEWLALKQHALKKMLKENSADYETIQVFLQQCLHSIEALIEPLLSDYERLVYEAKHQRVDYREMLKRSEHLQGRFTYFFRHSNLLFHPDRPDRDENICRIKTNLFQEFQQLAKASFERLDHGLVILKQCIPPSELALAKLREKLEQDLIIFIEELNQKFNWIETQYEEIKVRLAATETQHAEIRAKQDEIKTENAEIKTENAEIKAENAEIKAQSAEIKKTLEILLKRTSTLAVAEEEKTVDPTTTNVSFFRR
ncbi:MAG TPA: hypothetical protein VGH95_01025 [Candidatus Aquirickettsiella sp.]